MKMWHMPWECADIGEVLAGTPVGDLVNAGDVRVVALWGAAVSDCHDLFCAEEQLVDMSLTIYYWEDCMESI